MLSKEAHLLSLAIDLRAELYRWEQNNKDNYTPYQREAIHHQVQQINSGIEYIRILIHQKG